MCGRLLVALVVTILLVASAHAAQTVTSISLTNENVTPHSAAGTPIGLLTATTNNGPFSGTFSISNGTSSEGSQCGGANKADFEVVNGNVLAVLADLGPQTFGPNGITAGGNNNELCVTATPFSGVAMTRNFVISVQKPTFTSLTPYSMEYAGSAAPGTTLATLSTTITAGTVPSPSYKLGSDPACIGLVISGSNLNVGDSLYSGSGICHVNVTQGGVSPSPYIAAVLIWPGKYMGPGDFQGWQTWSGYRCLSAATAEAGTQKVVRLMRDSDLATLDVLCLPNGDMDIASAANFCAASYCYSYYWYDQSDVGNNFEAWQTHNRKQLPNNIFFTKEIAAFLFNCNGSLPCSETSNATDRFWDNYTFKGTSTTGTLSSVAMNGISVAETQQAIVAHCLNVMSVCVSLQYPSGSFIDMTVFTYYTHMNTTIGAGSMSNRWASIMGGLNSTGASFVNSNGTVVNGPLAFASIQSPVYFGGQFGGGAFQSSFMEENGISFNLFSSADQTNVVDNQRFYYQY